jgi:hypothetical protein
MYEQSYGAENAVKEKEQAFMDWALTQVSSGEVRIHYYKLLTEYNNLGEHDVRMVKD